MDLLIKQGFIVLCFISIYLLLKFKSPPKDIIKLINAMGSFIFAIMVFGLSLVTTPIPHFIFSYQIYAFILLEVIFAVILILFRRISSVWLIVVGSMCNLIIFAANNWAMPTFYSLESYNKAPDDLSFAWLPADQMHIIMTPETHLNILGDWIYVGISSPLYKVTSSILSIGDIMIIAGIFLLAYKAGKFLIGKELQKKQKRSN